MSRAEPVSLLQPARRRRQGLPFALATGSIVVTLTGLALLLANGQPLLSDLETLAPSLVAVWTRA